MQPESRRTRREERAQAAGGARIPRRSLVVTGVLLCGAVSIGAAATVAHSAAAAQQARNDAQIDAREWELRVVRGAKVEGLLDELTGDLASARDLAREVAMEQTLFSTLVLEGDHAGQGEAALSAAAPDAVMQRERLARFFAPETLAAGDAVGTSPSATEVGPGQIDPRDPWSVGTASDWKVVAVTPSEHAGEVDVTWLNTDTESGDLYAWARARYVVDRAVFHDLTVGATTVGADVATDPQKLE